MSEGFNIDDFIKDNIDDGSASVNNNPAVPGNVTINSQNIGSANQGLNVETQTLGSASTHVESNNPVLNPQSSVQSSGVHFTAEQVQQQAESGQPRIAAQDIIAGGVSNESIPQINEKLKRVETDYKPPSKFKIAMLIIFFILLLAFVIFLPDLSSLVARYKAGEFNKIDNKITSGKLKCTLSSNTTNLDMDYERLFTYTDNGLDKAEYTITTKGDPTQDEATLNEMNQKCQLLSTHTKGLDGVSVSCNYYDGKLVERQSFNYLSLDADSVDSAFSEAGGTYPEFSAGQDMDKIEKTMNAAGYSCTRIQ